MVTWYSYSGCLFSHCLFGINHCNSQAYKIFEMLQTGIGLIIGFLVYTIGLGLFQANAIQFALDQLPEAPTAINTYDLCIHW